MRYYDCGGYPLCSREVLALPALHALPEAGAVLFGFHRTPGAGRDTFPVTAPSLLTAEEGVSTLVTAEEPETDPALAAVIAAGRVRAVNLAHPRQEELLPPLRRRERVRVNLLALGDVGSTLLMGLRLLGGDVIDSVGICDVRENAVSYTHLLFKITSKASASDEMCVISCPSGSWVCFTRKSA